MDVTISEVGQYHEACRRLRTYSVDTPVFLSCSFLALSFAWRFESWPIAVFGVGLVCLALRSAIHQYRAHQIARNLEPRVQMFVRFYNRVGSGEASLQEVS